MNSLRNFLMATAVAMLLGSGSVLAAEPIVTQIGNSNYGYVGNDKSSQVGFVGAGSSAQPYYNTTVTVDYSNGKVGEGIAAMPGPEIDASSGTSAITLLTGVLTLAWKRSRSRQSAKSS